MDGGGADADAISGLLWLRNCVGALAGATTSRFWVFFRVADIDAKARAAQKMKRLGRRRWILTFAYISHKKDDDDGNFDSLMIDTDE